MLKIKYSVVRGSTSYYTVPSIELFIDTGQGQEANYYDAIHTTLAYNLRADFASPSASEYRSPLVQTTQHRCQFDQCGTLKK